MKKIEVTFFDFEKIMKEKLGWSISREQWDSLEVWEWVMKAVDEETWDETVYVKVTCHIQEIELKYSNTHINKKWSELLISNIKIPKFVRNGK